MKYLKPKHSTENVFPREHFRNILFLTKYPQEFHSLLKEENETFSGYETDILSSI
jgi:hypothetical protein